MVKQDKNYIGNKKKTFMKNTFIWSTLVALIFFISWGLMGERANYFTIIAAVLVIPLAQNLTRYISFRRFNDPNQEAANILEHMKGSYALYHGAIIPDTKETVYFPHLVVTSRSVFVLSDNNKSFIKSTDLLRKKLNAKGIELNNIHFIEISESNALKNAILKIEKDAYYTDQELDNRIAIIDAMLL